MLGGDVEGSNILQKNGINQLQGDINFSEYKHYTNTVKKAVLEENRKWFSLFVVSARI